MMLYDSGRDSGSQEETLSTPRRVQKRLFSPSNSSRRNQYRDVTTVKTDDEGLSGEDSDLGPMSPLALTDQSSCDSSPGRSFDSPLATPEKSPRLTDGQFDRLRSRSGRYSDGTASPFTGLRKLTRMARYSPRQIFNTPTKCSQSSNSQITYTENILTSPERTDLTMLSDEIVPETPGKNSEADSDNYMSDTPQKEETPERRLITPLSSLRKNIPLPRLHRRKSVGLLDTNDSSSPETTKVLKRHMDTMPYSPGSKLQKTDDALSIPKARAALFQDNTSSTNKSNKFSLNTKSFYGTKERKSFGFEPREIERLPKKRNYPSYASTFKRVIRRHRNGDINCGVGHAIKKPKMKPKPKISPNKSATVQNQTSNSKPTNENINPQVAANIPKSPEIDHTKRFFKTNRTTHAVKAATVTVNNNIKLTVADGKIGLQQKQSYKNLCKKPRISDLNFDTTDLSVDEPAIEATIEATKPNILQVLQADWADDDLDDMDTVQTAISPVKSIAFSKAVLMSPASELSNMASVMNIQDCAGLTSFSNTIENTNNVQTEPTNQKLYPLFTKGYTAANFTDGSNPRKRKRDETSWQTLAKNGAADNQYQLDAGQMKFGATQCPECGIVYHMGDPEDENSHLNYHNSIKTLRFQGWKNERVIFEDILTSSRIILVEPADSNSYWKKVSEVLNVVDRDLGLADTKLSYYRDKKIYLYVRDKNILGVLVAEVVKTAHRMIPELLELDCCTAESSPVKCGVNVVWTTMSHRRKGIASKLVDVLRTNFYYGYFMTMDDIAFSMPTPSGKIFAEKYTKTRNFKVYT